MSESKWHACVVSRLGVDWFRCRACNFAGTLAEAVIHAVENQVRA